MKMHGEGEVGSILRMWSKSLSFCKLALVYRGWKNANPCSQRSQERTDFSHRQTAEPVTQPRGCQHALRFDETVFRGPEGESLIQKQLAGDGGAQETRYEDVRIEHELHSGSTPMLSPDAPFDLSA